MQTEVIKREGTPLTIRQQTRREILRGAAALKPALQEALAARQPSVIDVRTSLKTTFADITSQLAKDASPRRR